MTAAIRTATQDDIPGIVYVHCESWRTTYPDIVSSATLALYTNPERRTKQWRNQFLELRPTDAIFVAEQAGEIVGFVCGGKIRAEVPGYDSELYAIYLLESAQGQGIGKRLMHTLAQHLIAQSFKTMILWVLEENEPSRRFYARMGGEVVTEAQFKLGEETLTEVAYGYDLRDLAEDFSEE